MLTGGQLVDVALDGVSKRYRVFVETQASAPDQRQRFALRELARLSGPLTWIAYHGDGEWSVQVLGGHRRCQVKEV